MQQIQTTVDAVSEPPTTPRCPECGAPIEGISSTGPDRHEFTGCGHEATQSTVFHTLQIPSVA